MLWLQVPSLLQPPGCESVHHTPFGGVQVQVFSVPYGPLANAPRGSNRFAAHAAATAKTPCAVRCRKSRLLTYRATFSPERSTNDIVGHLLLQSGPPLLRGLVQDRRGLCHHVIGDDNSL